MKQILPLVICLLVIIRLNGQVTDDSQSFKNEISLGYDVGTHLLAESLGESFLNQCDDENGCDRWNFDYGFIRLQYRYFFSEKFDVYAGLSLFSSYNTDKSDNELIISSTKFFLLPVVAEFTYLNTDHLRLSSGIGLTFILHTERDELLDELSFSAVPFPLLNLQIINATFSFGSQIHPYIGLGIGANLLTGGVSYQF